MRHFTSFRYSEIATLTLAMTEMFTYVGFVV